MALLHKLVDIAAEISDGHVTIMKFTTYWRVGFFTRRGTVSTLTDYARKQISEEAAERAIKERPTWGSVAEKIEQRKRPTTAASNPIFLTLMSPPSWKRTSIRSPTLS